ncbi:MAG TPA: hypothetical protein VMI75_21810 [Polyangiaceae bacterium]|nr:hypothetical protein [Polyangiaceae bacterium]
MSASSVALLVAITAFLAALLWQVRPVFLRREGDGTRGRGAMAVHLRAMRDDPASVRVVEQAVAALSRRPRALEVVLWRHLAAAPWESRREAVVASLDALRSLYEGRRRNQVRARAIAHARETIQPAGQKTVGSA